MGFYLLGLDRVTGELRTISSELYTTRAEALDALTAISSLHAFEHRDSEVFVADLDAATPVLLVASRVSEPEPAAETIPEDVPEPEEPVSLETVVVEQEPVPAEDARLAADTGFTAEPDLVGSETVVEEPIAEAVIVEALAGGLEPQQIGGEDAVSVVAEGEVPADEPVDEFAAIADEVEERESGNSLAHALKRATVTMEASGVVAPESVDALPVADLASANDADLAGDVEEAPVTAAPAAWPWTVDATGGAPDASAEPATHGPTGEPEPESPVSLSPTPPVFVPDPLEEPDVDSTDLVTVRSDDASAEFDEGESDPERTELLSSGTAEPDDSAVESPLVAEDDSVSSAANGPADAPGTESGVDSVLADLEIIEEGTAPGGYTAPPAEEMIGGASGLTCDDCVYVNTCPNKEDLTPASCGTFQWKSD